jgi:hypothetical protein
LGDRRGELRHALARPFRREQATTDRHPGGKGQHTEQGMQQEQHSQIDGEPRQIAQCGRRLADEEGADLIEITQGDDRHAPGGGSGQPAVDNAGEAAECTLAREVETRA